MSIVTEYQALLAQYAPAPIRSDQGYKRALKQLEKLMVLRPNAARAMLIEVLSTMIEMYESREHPTPKVAPSEMLAHLIASRHVKSVEVSRQTGVPTTTLSNVLAGRRGISK